MIARTCSREKLVGLVLTLHLAGLPYRVIASELGVSYHTVRRLVANYTRARCPTTHPPLDPAPTTASPDEDTTT
jgi:transposase